MKKYNISKRPLVTIITVNYQQIDVTLEMLASLKDVTYPNFEVIVVDNGSKGDDPGRIKEEFPHVKLIISPDNLGFAGGNNLAVKEASGQYLLFLNNDTEVSPGFLEPLVEVFENNGKAGMVSPKILYWDSPDKKTLQYAGSTGINPYTVRGKKIGSFEIDKGQYNDVRETALGHGAAMMVPIQVILEVGLMADIFFLYYEEHDWCERIKRAGYKVVYVGTSKVFHKESMSVGRNTPLKAYYMNRGRLIYTRRNLDTFKKTISLLFFVFLSFPKNVLSYMLKRDFRQLSAFLSACWWNLKHMGVHKTPKLVPRQDGKYDLINTTFQEVRKFN